MSDWDPQLAKALLGAAGSFDQELCKLLDKLRATKTALDEARSQAAPHSVTLTEVTAHAACNAKGCAQCGGTGVAARSGTPFVAPAPLSQAQALALMQQQQQQQAQARLLLGELAALFTRVAHRLEQARAHAAELSALVQALSR